MNSTLRQPKARIEITRLENLIEKDIAVLLADSYANKKLGVTIYAMTDYNFQHQIESISGSFSISVLPQAVDNSGRSLIDIIEMQDIVKIYEFNKLKFIGIITDAGYSASIQSGKVARKINLSGYSMGGLLESLSFVLDRHLMNDSPDVAGENRKLFDKIAKTFHPGFPVTEAIKTLINSFFEVMGKTSLAGSSVSKHLIEKYIDLNGIDPNIKFQYSVAFSYYSCGENSIWQILKDLFPPPLFEMFLKLDEVAGKYKLVLRESPFPYRKKGVWNFLHWRLLPLFKIRPNLITHLDLKKSSQDLFTYVLATLPGSGKSREEAMIVDGVSASGAKDQKKLNKYGFRPLYIEQKFFNRDGSNDGFDSKTVTKETSSKVYDWFYLGDESYSGELEVMNWGELPDVGDRVSILGGEFYVERIMSRFTYAKTMILRIYITRGLDYKGKGVTSIKNISEKIGMTLSGINTNLNSSKAGFLFGVNKSSLLALRR